MNKKKYNLPVLADIQGVASYLIKASKSENEEITYDDLEKLLFYAWWSFLDSKCCELFQADWKLSFGHILLADEQVESGLRALLDCDTEIELPRDAKNALDWLCNSEGSTLAKMCNSIEPLYAELKDLGFKSLDVVTADVFLEAKRHEDSFIWCLRKAWPISLSLLVGLVLLVYSLM